MKKISVVVFLTLALMTINSFTLFAQSMNDITWLTEDYPPFNYEENGTKKGIAVDLLLEMFKRSGTEKGPNDIKVVPWARGVKLLETDKNTCLFSTTLTPHRKNNLGYKFVAPIPQTSMESSNHIIAPKASGIKIKTASELKNYRVGVVRGDVGQGLAEEAGVAAGNIDMCNNGDVLFKKIKKKRFDVASYGFDTFTTKLKEAGGNPDDYEIVFSFPPMQMGYAFNKNCDPTILKKLQVALDEITKDGTAEKIKNKYKK